MRGHIVKATRTRRTYTWRCQSASHSSRRSTLHSESSKAIRREVLGADEPLYK
jgi:hypothetical protein